VDAGFDDVVDQTEPSGKKSLGLTRVVLGTPL
jgi:hypothetical protein